MSSSMLADPKLELIHQVDTLRGYAERIVIQGETLSLDEAADQKAHMQDFFAAGEAYGLTQKEMVGLLLGQSSQKERECGCHSCNARKQV